MEVQPAQPALLEPSLSQPAGAAELYSARACFLISFLGGSLAALTMGWLNARRLGRLRQDAWLFALLGLGFSVLLYTFADAWNAGIEDVRWLGIPLKKRELRRISQLVVSVAIEEKRYAEAEQMLLALIRERPENGTLYAKYAWLMLLVLNVDKARALTREALRLAPTESLPQTLDLLLHLIEGSRAQAGDRLRELLSRDPESLRAAWLLLLVLSDEHRYAEALQIAREILRASPDDAEIVDTVIRLKAASHWLAKPNWPNTRFGITGAAATWALAVVALHLLQRYDTTLAGIGALVWLTYILYSWLHQPLLYRWLRHRGF